MSGSNLIANCPDIQDELNNYFLECDASALRQPAPFFDFLWSDLNRSGIQQMIAPGGGKIKKVVLRYDQLIMEDEATEVNMLEKSCTAETKRGELTESYTIDPSSGFQFEELISAADYAYGCKSTEWYLAKKIQKLIDATVRKAQTVLAERAVALVGNWDAEVDPVVDVGGVDFLKVATKKTGSSDINPGAFEDIDAAALLTNFCTTPLIFSGTSLWKYYRTMLAGCCSAQGIDLSEMLSQYGKAVMYDRKLAAALGGNDFAVMTMPKVLQPIYYTANDDLNHDVLAAIGGKAVFTGANYMKLVVQDPQSGLPVDLTIADNCGDVSLITRACVDVKPLPTDIFPSAHSMSGVTYFAGIKVVNS
ncbi:MAG: hypothetical protein DWQ44_08990 [Bacteroidetes bacterium]|nr:MAG: hypothetical protein DWQ33_02785 [Bacteroidota bacterium]REK06425.1 MAG: hypothetical protein DWQ39_02780 [Bacteroidota bacterium]REK33191.1 MAG: hypothetical protein DWQ44_08990 [Bacteroidota bacterium]